MPGFFYYCIRLMNKKLYIYFLFVNILLSGYYIDLWHNANTVSRLLPVKTIVENGTMCIDQYHEQTIDKALINGHYYSEKAPLPAFIVTPFYYFAYHSGLSKSLKDDDVLFMLGSILIGMIPFVLIVMLIFHSLVKAQWNIYKAMLLSLLLSYSTFVFIYVGTSFSHVMAALWVLLSFIFLKEKKKYMLAGLFTGLAFITEYPTGLILFLWPFLLYLQTKQLKPVVLFYTGVLPSLLVQLGYNYIYTGNPMDMLYNHQAIDFYHDPNTFIGFALPIPEAMWKLLVGFYRGLLFHAPILFLIFWLIGKEVIQSPSTSLKNYVLPLFILSYLLFSSYRVWYGGWCFGPRHFVPVTVLLIYYYAKNLEFKGIKGWMIALLSTTGILYIWLAKITLQYSINADYPNTLTDLLIPAYRDYNFNLNNFMSRFYFTDPKTAAFYWLLLFFIACLFPFYFGFFRKAGANKT